MGNLTAYSAITTKIRAMKSSLISDEQFEEIAGMHSVPELISYLQQFPSYSSLFENTDPNTIHRGYLEWLLNFTTYRDYSKLYNFAKDEQRKFMELYFTKFEIFSLKRYIRNILDIREDAQLVYMENNFELHSHLRTKELAHSADMNEFAEHLKGSIYYDTIRSVNRLDNSILFDYELALDLFYFANVWEQKDKLFKGADLKHIKNSFGTKIDLLNIMWIYRCKTYYRIPNSKIYSYLIQIYYKLKPAQVRDMIISTDAKTLQQTFLTTEYAKKYRDTFSNDSVPIEKIYNELLHTLYLNDFKNNPYSLAAIDTYFYLKELETSRIITAAECIRYGYPAAKTIDLIFRKGVS